MICFQCSKPIEPDRVQWCQANGKTCKYCKACSAQRKAARQGTAFVPPQLPTKTVEDEQKWHEIAVSKIVHNYMLEGMKKGLKPEESANIATTYYFAQKAAVNFILNKEKL